MVTLEELIARQRFSLNRSTRASKTASASQQPDAATAVQWVEFERTSAEATQELAEILERCSGQPCPMLHEARREMLAAADLVVTSLRDLSPEAIAKLIAGGRSLGGDESTSRDR